MTTETPEKAEENKSPAKINVTEEPSGKIDQIQDPENIDDMVFYKMWIIY